MIATVINVVLILVGSTLGLVFKNRISRRFTAALTSAISTQDSLCVIVCMVLGTLLGEALRIEERLEGVGDILRSKVLKGQGNSRFAEGFVNAFVLFCVGAMAINGAMEAGMNGSYDILISKGVIDGVTAISFAAAMGVGVAFSVIPLFLYQGGLTLIFAAVGQGMDPAVVTEMSAVGGVIIMGIAVNMLGLPKEKIRVGNMLPAMFLPLAYLPLKELIAAVIS